MIQVDIDAGCSHDMAEFGFTESEVIDAINHRDCGMVANKGSRLASLRWLSANVVLLVEAAITAQRQFGPKRKWKIERVTAQLVVRLRPQLTAGRLIPGMDMELALASIAEEFGKPLRCDPASPFSTLYSGPAVLKGDAVANLEIQGSLSDGAIVNGTFNRDEQWASNVWVFNPTKYRKWFAANFKNIR